MKEDDEGDSTKSSKRMAEELFIVSPGDLSDFNGFFLDNLRLLRYSLIRVSSCR